MAMLTCLSGASLLKLSSCGRIGRTQQPVLGMYLAHRAATITALTARFDALQYLDRQTQQSEVVESRNYRQTFLLGGGGPRLLVRPFRGVKPQVS